MRQHARITKPSVDVVAAAARAAAVAAAAAGDVCCGDFDVDVCTHSRRCSRVVAALSQSAASVLLFSLTT